MTGRLLSVAFTALLSVGLACSTPRPTADVDCGQPDLLRSISYCVSPEATDVSARNAATARGLARNDPASLPIELDGSFATGPADAPVTIVVFSDLQCPACAFQHQLFAPVQQKYAADIRIVFKHFPLSQHQHAPNMAREAMAAGEQGKFWEYVDAVYEDNFDPSINREVVASRLGLDLEAWKRAAVSASVTQQLEEDRALGIRLGVDATPTAYVNGIKLPGVFAPQVWEAVIEYQLGLAASMEEAGVPRDEIHWRLTNAQLLDATSQLAMPEDSDDEPPEPQGRAQIAYEGTHTLGSDDPLLTMVIFSSFQCPFSARFAATMYEAIDRYPQLRVVYRHFPLDSQRFAAPMAVLSEAAATQGNFWEFHDAVYAHDGKLNEDIMMALAEKFGFGPEDIENVWKNEDLYHIVRNDYRMGEESGVRGTPTSFINGREVGGAQTIERLVAILDIELALAEKVALETGKSGPSLYETLLEME